MRRKKTINNLIVAEQLVEDIKNYCSEFYCLKRFNVQPHVFKNIKYNGIASQETINKLRCVLDVLVKENKVHTSKINPCVFTNHFHFPPCFKEIITDLYSDMAKLKGIKINKRSKTSKDFDKADFWVEILHSYAEKIGSETAKKIEEEYYNVKKHSRTGVKVYTLREKKRI